MIFFNGRPLKYFKSSDRDTEFFFDGNLKSRQEDFKALSPSTTPFWKEKVFLERLGLQYQR
jgi:hypothetical protein